MMMAVIPKAGASGSGRRRGQVDTNEAGATHN